MVLFIQLELLKHKSIQRLVLSFLDLELSLLAFFCLKNSIMQKPISLLFSLIVLSTGAYITFNSLYNPSHLDDGSYTIFFLIFGIFLFVGGLLIGFISLKSSAQLLHIPLVIKLILAVLLLGLMGVGLLRLLV